MNRIFLHINIYKYILKHFKGECTTAEQADSDPTEKCTSVVESTYEYDWHWYWRSYSDHTEPVEKNEREAMKKRRRRVDSGKLLLAAQRTTGMIIRVVAWCGRVFTRHLLQLQLQFNTVG